MLNNNTTAVSYTLSSTNDTDIKMHIVYESGEEIEHYVGFVDRIQIVKHFKCNKETKFNGWV